MTPNTKHLEILSEVSTYGTTYLKKEYAFVYASEALAAMQILQLRIDELEKENERLKSVISKISKVNIVTTNKPIFTKNKPSITEHKLRELKNPRNPEI